MTSNKQVIDKWQSILNIPSIEEFKSVSGGDVNQAYKVETDSLNYFLLTQPGRQADFYEGEVASLKELSRAQVPVPDVITYGQTDKEAYLLLSYLEEDKSLRHSDDSQSKLGRVVAEMHQYMSENHLFGFDYPHQGSDMSFSNAWTDSWIELFIENRMDQLHQRLLDDGIWQKTDSRRYQQVRTIMVDTLKQYNSQPSLLHGDLWAGNYMITTDGQPALFDPSSFYGDREFDLGATLVFGGFTEKFYQAYNEIYPLEEGYQLRIEFYKLYLLLVHLMKFQGPYAEAVNQSMEKIVGYGLDNSTKK